MLSNRIKTLTVFAALTTLFALSACSEQGTGTTTGGSTAQTQSTDTSAVQESDTSAANGDVAAVQNALNVTSEDVTKTASRATDTARKAVDKSSNAIKNATNSVASIASTADQQSKGLSTGATDAVRNATNSSIAGQQNSLTANSRPDPRRSKPATTAPAKNIGISPDHIVIVDPPALDLGRIPTNQQGSGTVTLINTGDKPMILNQCKTSCGCTTTNCPQGQVIQPGEAVEIEVKLRGGAVGGRKITKVVTFMVEGQPPLRMNVSGETFAYVTLEPLRLNPELDQPRVVLTSLEDDTPFKIIRMHPPMVDPLPAEAASSHTLTFNYEDWEAAGSPRKVVFYLDHPKADRLYLDIFKPGVKPPRTPTTPTTRPGSKIDIASAANNGVKPPPPTPVVIDPAKNFVDWMKIGSEATIKAALSAIKDGTVDANMRDNRGAPILCYAAQNGRADVVQALIDAGADMDAGDPFGWTPITHAARGKSVQCIRVLLDAGADVNARDQINASPLIWAAGVGDAASLKEILNAGADLDVKDLNGYSPLIWAAGFGDVERVNVLIDAGVDLEWEDFVNGATALLYACRTGQPDSVQALIDAGVNLEAADKEGRNALAIARERQDLKRNDIIAILEPLLDKKEKSE